VNRTADPIRRLEGVDDEMTIRATRATRLLMALCLACLGLALGAQAAHATWAKVTIVKINEGGNQNDLFTFHPDVVPSQQDFSIKAGDANQYTFQVECNVDRPGQAGECSQWSYPSMKVTELDKPGYTLKSIACYHTQGSYDFGAEPNASSQPDGDTTVSGSTIDLKVNWYEWVKCYVTNAPPAPPPAGAPAADTTTPAPAPVAAPPPRQQVSPARVVAGTAKLSGPTGCPTTNAVAATVTGKRIVKVTFYVDGRKVKTVNKPNAKGRWSLALNMRSIAYGTHRVRARVQFAKSSGTQPKTLRLSFNRCHAAGARPQFTG
jgi:hypothetical protein